MALAINDNNFEELVMKADKPVLLDFGATWCGPCKALSPIIDEIATEYEGRAVVGKVDVEESPVLSGTYKIRNVPTVLFIVNGEIKDKSVGAVPKAKLTEKLGEKIVLVGDEKQINEIANENNLDISKAIIINPKTSDRKASYCDRTL